MKAVITGLNGTLAPVLCDTLVRQGHEVIGWDRAKVSTQDPAAMVRFLDGVGPNWVCHLAMGAEAWAGSMADYCHDREIGFLFTSSAMVFDHEPDGPHRVEDTRTAKDDYGRYKVRCEDAIRAVSDRAIIARIGWQIGAGRGGNQMFEALSKTIQDDGVIRASTLWTPATSFMDDTCGALVRLMLDRRPGTYHLDSNAQDALNYFELVTRLVQSRGREWAIEPTQEYNHDQRLLDERVRIPPITDRLDA